MDIFPAELGHPYYILSGPYSRFSAGNKVLHLLCHSLNSRGRRAYMQIYPDLPVQFPAVHPDLLTPRLTQNIVDHHFQHGITPIVIYPEVLEGNPLGAPFVVRYVMNYPGLIGGNNTFSTTELCFGYSSVLAEYVGHPGSILFLPVSNTSIFHPPSPGSHRSGTCYYAHKYRTLHGEVPVPPDPDSIEITRHHSPNQMADIFRSSELLYCFENTSTALDAALCGCPVVFIPNPYLTECIARSELSLDGYAWSADPAEIARARATVGNAALNYSHAVTEFWGQLDSFIALTQARAAQTEYAQPLNTPFKPLGSAGRMMATLVTTLSDLRWRRGTRGVFLQVWETLQRLGLYGIWRQIQQESKKRF